MRPSPIVGHCVFIGLALPLKHTDGLFEESTVYAELTLKHIRFTPKLTAPYAVSYSAMNGLHVCCMANYTYIWLVIGSYLDYEMDWFTCTRAAYTCMHWLHKVMCLSVNSWS